MACSSSGIVTDVELTELIPGSLDKRYGQVKRAIADERLIHLKRGLYALPVRYRRKPYQLFDLAAYLYGPPYISFESALSYHGWIPESVPITASATPRRKAQFVTSLGTFQYFKVPEVNSFVEVQRVESKDQAVFFMASPWKAIFDYVHVFKKDWDTVAPLFESLRIEPDFLVPPTRDELDSIATHYHTQRIQRFMRCLRKEWGL